jgi:hypothetical protein
MSGLTAQAYPDIITQKNAGGFQHIVLFQQEIDRCIPSISGEPTRIYKVWRFGDRRGNL